MLIVLIHQQLSIHTPREGSDGIVTLRGLTSHFQSTLPVRGATPKMWLRSD